MSRSIQVGDIAEIIVNGASYNLPITNITHTEIIAGNYSLGHENGQWIVKGYNYPHIIQFKAGEEILGK
jgi:hypothetical protein